MKYFSLNLTNVETDKRKGYSCSISELRCKLVQNFLEDNLAVSMKFKMFVQFDPTTVLLGTLGNTHTYAQR